MPKSLRNYSSALALAFMATACGPQSPPPTTNMAPSDASNASNIQEKANETQTQFLDFLEYYAKNTLNNDPLMATSLGVTEEYLGKSFNNRLKDYSIAALDRDKSRNAATLSLLNTLDRTHLSGVALTTYDTLLRTLTLSDAFKPYVNGAYSDLSIFSPFLISQLSGPHIDIPRSLQTEHPLTNKKEVNDFIERLELFLPTFKDIAQRVHQDGEQGILPPKFAIAGAIRFIEEFLNNQPAKHPLVNVFAKKITSIGNLDQKAQAKLVDRAVKALNTSVYPGYRALLAELKVQLSLASDHAGIWDLKNGADLYQLALNNFGAGGKTAEEIHQIGLREVDRIQQEMDTILRAQGLTDGPIMTRYVSLTQQPQNLYPNTDDGRQALLADLNRQMADIQSLLPNILITLPKANVEVRRIAEYEQDGAPGGYYTGPSLDGSRPGIYWINLKNTADWPKFTLPTLTYHEASPGHHLQIAISQQIQDMPMIRNLLWYSAYGEGWALYAEVLAKELGLYKNDPLGDLGRLQSELFRAARLVVDTGLHHKRWSREKAIDYMVNTLGDTEDSVTREVERYAVWPGQACSYKLGQMTILELRARVQSLLKERFDLRAFNDQLLIHGAVPLTVLEKNMMDWAQSQ